MKIGWLSATPQAKTGYGTQTYEVVSRLLKHHDVKCIAQVADTVIWGARQHVQSPQGEIEVLPLTHPATQLINSSYLPVHKFDVIIGFMDAFGMEYLNGVKCPVVGWIPIDGNLTEKWTHLLRNYYKVFGYAKFGYNELKKWFPPAKIDYIRHGISETYLKEYDKDEIREELATQGIPKDSFLITNVGANVGPRKELPLMMMTFKRFIDMGYDAHLFIHTNAHAMFPRGYDLLSWHRMLGLEGKVHFPTFNPILDPASEERLARLHTAGDLYTQNSVAEGFGLPEYEALATETPVACPNNSSQVEIIKGTEGDRRHGWLVDCVDPNIYAQIPVYVPMLPTYPVPNQESLLECWIEAYENPDLGKKYGRAGRKYIKEYHGWDTIMPNWFKALDRLEEELSIFKSIEYVFKPQQTGRQMSLYPGGVASP